MPNDTVTKVINAIPIPVLVVDPDDRVSALNDPMSLILGDDLVGHHYITALRQPALLDSVAAVRKNKDVATTRYLGRDGARDTTYQVSVRRAGPDILLCFEDQTKSEEAGKMRRDFVANVSHELRTPLTALSGFIETLNGAARDDAAARDRFLTIMSHEANRMIRLVDDLLSLSRVEEDERVRPREHVELGALLSSVIKGLSPLAEDAGVSVKLELQSPEETIPGDPGKLMQVFTNLVENATKYGAAGGEVVVTLTGRQEQSRLRTEGVTITVEDQGDGIASHHIARLTERFYRVDSHRSREVGGTGLGLAIVKHIINRHRGRLVIESEEGRGTKVSVILPTE